MLVCACAAVCVLAAWAGEPESAEPGKSVPGAPISDQKPEPATEQAEQQASAAAPAVPYPHPIITEVLYAVPTGAGGDANRDGKRDAAGDEFIELINPHDRPIQLFGYTLTDSQEPGKGQMKFTFPALELAPGATVLVFNGLNSTFSGPAGAGDSKAPPISRSEHFAGALVFTMKNTSARIALGNSGDHVLLSAPDKTPVQRVYWSEAGPGEGAKPPIPPAGLPAPKSESKPTPLVEDYAPLAQKGSVQRDSVLASGRFVAHMEADHTPYSPGAYTLAKAPQQPAAPVPGPTDAP